MTDKAPSQLSEHSQSEVHASAFKPAEHPVTALALLRVPAWEPERLAAQLDLDWNIKASLLRSARKDQSRAGPDGFPRTVALSRERFPRGDWI